MKAQTKALLASVVVIALALSAVSGVTYSWWSDSEQTEITVNTGYVDVTTSGFSITKGGDTVEGVPDNSSIPGTMGISYDHVGSTDDTEWDPNSNTLNVAGDPDDVIVIKYTVTFSWSVAAKYIMDFGTGSQRLDLTMTIEDGSTTPATTVSKGVWIPSDGKQSPVSYDVELVINGLGMNVRESLTIKNYITQSAHAVDIWNGSTSSITPTGDVYEIYHASELAWVAEKVNSGEESFIGSTVRLMKDIDLNGLDWEPIGNAFYTESDPHVVRTFGGIFDGNGMVITGLRVDVPVMMDNNYAAGLFGWFGSSSGSKVMDLTITGATILGHHDVGGVVGYLYYGTISGCIVKDSVITNIWEDAEKGGDKTGGIVGYMNENVSVCGNTIKNVSITGCRDLGAISGILWSSNTFENNSILGTTSLEYSAIGSPDSHVNGNLGQIVGRLEGATVSSTNTVEGTMVASTIESLNSLVESGATSITLADDLGSIPSSLKSLGTSAERVSLTLDLAGHMISDSGNNNIVVKNAELVLKNGKIKNMFCTSDGVISVDTGVNLQTNMNRLVLENMEIAGVYGVAVSYGGFDIEIKDTTIIAEERCVTTYANKQGTSSIDIQRSVLKTTGDNSTSLDLISWDDGATMTVSDSHIISKGRCAVVRNGDASFVNTVFTYGATGHNDSKDQAWTGGPGTSYAALAVGGLQNTNGNYYQDVSVRLIGCSLELPANVNASNLPWAIVVGQDMNNEVTTLTLDDSSDFSVVHVVVGALGHSGENLVTEATLLDGSTKEFSWSASDGLSILDVEMMESYN